MTWWWAWWLGCAPPPSGAGGSAVEASVPSPAGVVDSSPASPLDASSMSSDSGMGVTGRSAVTGATGDSAAGVTGDSGSPCAYPTGAVEPMAVGSVLEPYRWPAASSLDGSVASLDLADVPCAVDDDIDWSPFDVLVFVSIPAW